MDKTKRTIAAVFIGVTLITATGCENQKPDIREYEIEKVIFDRKYREPTYSITLVNPKLQSDSIEVTIDKDNFNKSKHKVGNTIKLDVNNIGPLSDSIYRKGRY